MDERAIKVLEQLKGRLDDLSDRFNAMESVLIGLEVALEEGEDAPRPDWLDEDGADELLTFTMALDEVFLKEWRGELLATLSKINDLLGIDTWKEYLKDHRTPM